MKFGVYITRQRRGAAPGAAATMYLVHVTDTDSFWSPHKHEAMPIDELNFPVIPYPFDRGAGFLICTIGV